MKRADAFILAVTAFIFANCISYFVRSGTPYVTGWGMLRPGAVDIQEAIGFPLEVYGLGGGFLSFSWIICLGNIVVALTASALLSICLAKQLPPLWPGQSRAFRYSLRALLGGITVICILLGIAMTSRSLGLVVRNVACLSGPVAAYAWLLYRRQVSWVRLGVVAAGFTLIALAVDFHYQDPPIDGHLIVNALLPDVDVKSPQDWTGHAGHGFALTVVGLTTIRAVVPIFGLLSLLAIAFATYSVMRQYYPLWTRRNADLSSTADHGAEPRNEEEPRNPCR